MDSTLNSSPVKLPCIPHACTWDVLPVASVVPAANALSITAGSHTDLFTDPRGEVTIANSPRLMFASDGDCILRAKVTVDFGATYDAGVLLAYIDERRWGKLCFEFSPQGQPMVVSVVTKGESDDCNSVVVDGRTVYLRLSRLANAFAFHYSLDGALWHMVRYFNLSSPGASAVDETPAGVKIGFSSQSPTGERCTALFEDIAFVGATLANIRSGE